MTPAPDKPAAPPVAVVIVTNNSEAPLQRCLENLHSKFATIVVDNGAGQTEGFENRFPSTRFIRLPRNFGLTKALNLGIRAAEAEHVLLLSPSVEILPEAVEILARTLDTEPGVGAVCPRLLGRDGEVLQVTDLPSSAVPDPALRPGNAGETARCASGDALMLRLFFLRALRQIDERYGDYGSNIELCQQVLRASKTVRVDATATALLDREPRAPSTAQAADKEIGIARFLSKHTGFFSGVRYWIGRVFASLFSFQLAKLRLLLTWKKIDGN